MGRKKKSKAKGESAVENAPRDSDSSSAGVSSQYNKEDTKSFETDIFTCDISPIYGRFLKAKTDVKRGTMILAERFLIAGPMRSSDIVCVGCHSDFKDPKDRIPCPRCSWPICSKKCADTIFHIDECKFFTERKLKPPISYGNSEFGALTVLRGLILKIQDPKKWKTLMKLEAHNEIRKTLPLWRENTINVVDIILRDYDLADVFTAEEAHTVCGILEVNAFELGEKSSFRGIYPTAAMCAHDCIPNTTRYENPVTGVLEIRAAVDIPAGQSLTVCYAFSLEATAQRRKMLSETKFFECSCKRCCDPRELNSNMGTLICQTCKGGDILNLGACDLMQTWTCNACGSREPVASIEAQLEKWQEVVNSVNDIPSSEKFLLTCKTLFHPTHFVPFDIKFNLCQAYGREADPLEQLTTEDLDRKLELCREVLKVLDIVTPGYTVTRGLILYELQAAEVIHARRLHDTRKITAPNLRRKLQLTLKTLKEAITILEFCYPESIEYEISQAAKAETLPELIKWINNLK